ncbi:hypothetical protein STA3757_39550 [Stanieria sp. NIES-3757]|nr:hypothetical protein STA3757_39550 [Stanieria sp. NIES-3757]
MEKTLFLNKENIKVRALFLGQRIDIKALENVECLTTNPLIVSAGEFGCAVLFRYGVVVLFGLEPIEEATFLNNLKPLILEPFAEPEVEDTEIYLDNNTTGKVLDGNIFLPQFTLKSLQIVADILAKSVVLAHYELQTSSTFDRIEPFAVSLQNTSWSRKQVKELLKLLGSTLSIQHKVMGRVEVIDKPELLWDYPELERLYLRLEDEYEIRERDQVLERKLESVSRTAETALGLLQHNTSLRVEWYIVILIVMELVLSLYGMFAGV